MAHPAGPEAEAGRLSDLDDEALTSLAVRLQAMAVAGSLTVATAESCTGGLVGHSITSVAGSSAYYLGGIISYADDAKIALLGVPASIIQQHGAVSAQVAVSMAEGVRVALGSDVAAAVTGIAGPDGGTAAKPVGLTYVAVATTDGHDVRRHRWSGDRRQNKAASAAAVLELLIDTLASQPTGARGP